MHEPPISRAALLARMATLQGEASSGQRLLAECEARAESLRQQLLRIDGAARVLRELLDEPQLPADSLVEGPAARGGTST
jgi:hypothetical protein